MSNEEIALGIAVGLAFGALVAACVHLARGWVDARRDGGAS